MMNEKTAIAPKGTEIEHMTSDEPLQPILKENSDDIGRDACRIIESCQAEAYRSVNAQLIRRNWLRVINRNSNVHSSQRSSAPIVLELLSEM